jgi:hypothetical protein
MNVQHKRIRRLVMIALAILPLALAAQTPVPRSAHKAHPPITTPPAPPPEIAMPFHAGEKLDYRIAWSAFSTAANLELGAIERRDLYGWHTWHFRAAFHTIKPVRNLFTIDDQFDSYTDASSLECRQFEAYLNEMGKSSTSVQHLIPTGQHTTAPGASVVVLPGTRDPLGMLFTLRGADWQRSPDLRAPVFDGQNLYDMHAHLEAAADPVKVDAGSFTASRVSITVFQNDKQNPAIHFVIWFANDATHKPVLVTADLPFGTLRVELTAAK